MRLLIALLIVLALAVPALTEAAQAASPPSAPSQPSLSRHTSAQPPVTEVAMAQPLLSRPASTRPVVSLPATPRTAARQTANADPATLCETAITTAEYVNRLPSRLLEAISLTETGRVEAATGRVRPWPWTINAEGEGQFFATRQDAIAAVKALQDRGVRAIDVGCMQVDLMYHPDAFASLDDAFDPRSNAIYAARFLNALYAGSKDWAAAIGAYHSETPALGDAYRVLVMARWQNGDPRAATPGQVTLVTGAVAYGDFAQAGNAYGEKAHGAYDDRAYGAFAPRSLVYGSFAPR